jgi:WD40 repeat protein
MAEIGDDGSGKVVFQFVVPMRCRAIAFADDETLLATNSSGQVSRIHLPLNKLPRRLLFDKAASPRIDFSPDNRLLVVTREAVELYDLRASGNPLRNRRVEKGIASAVYSPDGSTLLIACQAIDASGKNTHQITILDAATWQSIRSVSPVAPDCTVKFVNNGHNIVTLSDDHVDRWFEYPSLQPCAAPVADMGIIALPHLDWFLGGMHAEGLTCFDRSGERWRQKISGMRDRHAVAISPDGKCIAIGRHNGNITFYDPRNGRTESAFLATDIRIDRLVYSADARTLAGWTGHQKLKLWHVATGRDLLEIPVIGMGVDQLAFSPDGRVLAVAGVASSGNGQVLLYQTYDP